MDEELEQPNKISPESFFEQLTEVRETADAAQKTSNSNLNLLNSLKTQVDVISSDFKLFKDEKADEAFEEEDRKQKELMDQRAKAQGEKKGEGTSSESGEPEEQEKGLLGSIGDFISNFFGGLVGGVAGLAISGVGTLLNFGSSAVQGAKDLGKDIAEKLKGTGDDIKEKGKNILGGIKKTFSGIGDRIKNFDGRPGSRKTKGKTKGFKHVTTTDLGGMPGLSGSGNPFGPEGGSTYSPVEVAGESIKSDLTTITVDGKRYPRGLPGSGETFAGKGGSTYGFNQGGEVDSVPAMLTPGEFVVTKDAVNKVGVDTLKGLNASVGATNKPTLMKGTTDSFLGEHSIEFAGFNKGPVEKSMRMTDEGLEKTYFDDTTDIYELSSDDEYFHSKDEMIGAGMSSETISKYKNTETTDDGTESTFSEEVRTKDLGVSIGVPDLIEHRNQLMSEINKLKGFEKVTFDQFMKKEHGIPQELLLPILYRSDASKATRKKMDRANKLDREQGVKPTSAYGNSLGYRQNQMNPATYVSSQDQFTERDVSTFKYDAAKDPTLAKGFSQGGLVTSKNIKPVIESNEKDLSSTIIQSLGANNQAIQVLNAQNQINNPVDMNQNSPALVQASKPNVSEANIKVTEAPIPFRKLLSSKKYLSVTSNSKSGLPPEIAKMLS